MGNGSLIPIKEFPNPVSIFWLQFIYDMWYGSLTPDKEFPREVRRVLNTAFGELAGRARKTDLKGMLLRYPDSAPGTNCKELGWQSRGSVRQRPTVSATGL